MFNNLDQFEDEVSHSVEVDAVSATLDNCNYVWYLNYVFWTTIFEDNFTYDTHVHS